MRSARKLKMNKFRIALLFCLPLITMSASGSSMPDNAEPDKYTIQGWTCKNGYVQANATCVATSEELAKIAKEDPLKAEVLAKEAERQKAEALAKNVERERQKAEARAKNVSVLGVYLGADTLYDIQARAQALTKDFAKYSENSCGKLRDIKVPTSISALDQLVWLSDVKGNSNPDKDTLKCINDSERHLRFDGKSLMSAKFAIDENELVGLFLNGVIVEIKPLETLYSEDGPKLRKLLNKKYVKGKSVTKKHNFSGVRTTYLYETWRENSGAFTIELAESRSTVHDFSACLELKKLVNYKDPMSQCKIEASNIPQYVLSYRDDKLFLPLLSELSKVVKKSKDAEKKKSEDKFNRF